MSDIPRKIDVGVWYLGKERENGKGSNIYFDTKEVMGTWKEPDGHINYKGVIVSGRRSNPNGYMSLAYALSDDSYLREGIKSAIRKVLAVCDGVRRNE